MTEEKRVTTYLHEERLPYPFCPGCGHGIIMDSLNAALVELQLDQRQVVIVVDIGCVALCREYWDTNWVLGLHGRSLTYATGIKLANPELEVIVLIGDGGVGIGGHHLINAARRNIGVTTLVFNNLNFGMTGGEHSITTPQASVTATTAYGHLERPLDVCATAAVSGASFVARATTSDAGLIELIAQAIRNDGFSLIDIWEFCTSYYVPYNRFGRKQMNQTLEALNFPTGIVHQEMRPEYSQAYRTAVAGSLDEPVRKASPITPKYQHDMRSRQNIVVAGAAGQKIRSAAGLFSQGAVLSGLWASQRSEYPVTVKSGFSVSEIILSPEPILFSGVPKPDLMVVLFSEGLTRVQSSLDKLTAQDTLIISADLLRVETPARTVVLDFERAGDWSHKKSYWAIMALAEVLRIEQLYPLDALKEVIVNQERYAEQNLVAVEASEAIGVDL